jgi:hypothetical protein
MAGFGPAIHVFIYDNKTWMPGTRPGMTKSKPPFPPRRAALTAELAAPRLHFRRTSRS